MGIFTKINSYKNEVLKGLGQDFDYSLTANPILINRTRRNVEEELDFPQPLRYLIKIDDVEKYFNEKVEEKDTLKKNILKMEVYGAKDLNKLTNLGGKPPQPKGVTFREISKFDERIDAFNEKVKPHYNFLVERTMKYMNWRYCDKRGGDFKVWIAEEGGEIIGYLVLRINTLDQDHPDGYIIDLLALNGREDVVESFIELAVDHFTKRNVNVVYAQVILGHPYKELYGKYGFLDSRMKPFLRYRAINLGDDLKRFTESPGSMFHYTYGEGDAI
jgi:hypothetical protein